MVKKKYAVVNEKRCVACGACMKECPRDAIRIWRGCYAVVNKDNCIGCGKCEKVCPAGCVSREERTL